MEKLNPSDRRIKKASVVQGGLAAFLLATTFVACGDVTPKPSSAATPTETNSPKATAMLTEAPKPTLTDMQVEDLALYRIGSEFNIMVSESDMVVAGGPIFASSPDSEKALEQALASFPSDFLTSPDGETLKITLDEFPFEKPQSQFADTVYLPEQDLGYADSLQPGSMLDSDLAQVLAQRKDFLLGHTTTNEIVALLGGDKFVKNPAGLYPRLNPKNFDETIYDPAEFAFPRTASGGIDTSKLVGGLAWFFVTGDETTFVANFGDIVSPGVKMSDANYATSKVHQLFDGMNTLFEGKIFPAYVTH
jgi:hypothetical protein